MNNLRRKSSDNFYNRVSELLRQARQTVVKSINKTMVSTYYEIGRMIVEEEQEGKERAEYGKHLIFELSRRFLEKDFRLQIFGR